MQLSPRKVDSLGSHLVESVGTPSSNYMMTNINIVKLPPTSEGGQVDKSQSVDQLPEQLEEK